MSSLVLFVGTGIIPRIREDRVVPRIRLSIKRESGRLVPSLLDDFRNVSRRVWTFTFSILNSIKKN